MIHRTFSRTGAPRAVVQTFNTTILSSTLGGAGSQNLIASTSTGILVIRVTHRTGRDGDHEAIVDYCTYSHDAMDHHVTGISVDVQQPAYIWTVTYIGEVSSINTKLISRQPVCTPRSSIMIQQESLKVDSTTIQGGMSIACVRGYAILTSSTTLYVANITAIVGTTTQPDVILQRPIFTTPSNSLPIRLLSSITPYMDAFIHVIQHNNNGRSVAITYRSSLPFMESGGININAMRAPLYDLPFARFAASLHHVI
jgi:hypothetical protein